MIIKIRFAIASQLFFLAASIWLAKVAFAAAPAREYELVPQPGARPASGVSFQIAYTFGVHNGSSASASGTATASLDPLELRSARFSVPIASMTTGSALRDCHMRESLGLDYSRSRFPGEHVCSIGNDLPASGNDAIAFPTIDFNFVRVSASRPGAALDFDVEAEITVHGVQRRMEVPIRVETADGGKLRVKSTFEIKLADHGIVVKPFSGVNVRDRARVVLDLVLSPVAGGSR